MELCCICGLLSWYLVLCMTQVMLMDLRTDHPSVCLVEALIVTCCLVADAVTNLSGLELLCLQCCGTLVHGDQLVLHTV